MVSSTAVFSGLTRKIEVVVEVHGLASKFISPGEYKLKRGATVETLIEKAARPGRRPPVIVMIDGERVLPTRTLSDGDSIRVFGFAAGG